MSLNKEGDLCGKHAQSAFSAFSWHSACRHKALLVHRAVPARKADPVRKGHRVPARPGPTTRRIPGKNPQTRVANRISARALVSQAKAGPQHRTRLDQEAKAKAGPDLRRRAGNKNPNTQLLTHGAALIWLRRFVCSTGARLFGYWYEPLSYKSDGRVPTPSPRIGARLLTPARRHLISHPRIASRAFSQSKKDSNESIERCCLRPELGEGCPDHFGVSPWPSVRRDRHEHEYPSITTLDARSIFRCIRRQESWQARRRRTSMEHCSGRFARAETSSPRQRLDS
jgi:hypothetical protein